MWWITFLKRLFTQLTQFHVLIWFTMSNVSHFNSLQINYYVIFQCDAIISLHDRKSIRPLLLLPKNTAGKIIAPKSSGGEFLSTHVISLKPSLMAGCCYLLLVLLTRPCWRTVWAAPPAQSAETLSVSQRNRQQLPGLASLWYTVWCRVQCFHRTFDSCLMYLRLRCVSRRAGSHSVCILIHLSLLLLQKVHFNFLFFFNSK